jgi:hypothetical protein
MNNNIPESQSMPQSRVLGCDSSSNIEMLEQLVRESNEYGNIPISPNSEPHTQAPEHAPEQGSSVNIKMNQYHVRGEPIV